jgi:hypothetical protein
VEEHRYSSNILDLGTNEGWSGQFHATATLPQKKSLRYLLNRMKSGLQSRLEAVK